MTLSLGIISVFNRVSTDMSSCSVRHSSEETLFTTNLFYHRHKYLVPSPDLSLCLQDLVERLYLTDISHNCLVSLDQD